MRCGGEEWSTAEDAIAMEVEETRVVEGGRLEQEAMVAGPRVEVEKSSTRAGFGSGGCCCSGVCRSLTRMWTRLLTTVSSAFSSFLATVSLGGGKQQE